MATNMHIILLLLYNLSLKLELVCHLVFNRHEIFTYATSIILLRKRVFNFGIALSGIGQCDDKANFSVSVRKTFVYCHTVQHLKVVSKNKITEVA